MSHKQVHEPHPSHMDGVKVKISEKYKPPPRISLPMSYSQRLSLNKHIQDSVPQYDFSLEKTVKERLKEWRLARQMTTENRRVRLEKVKESRAKEKEEKNQEQNCDADVKTEETVHNLNNTNQGECKSFSAYPSSTGVLIPMQITTTNTNILTPTLSADFHTQPYICKPTDKSPFNISDFEADTSSPFDNMELKTINDMAELALVLQSDDKKFKTEPYSYAPSYSQPYSNYGGQNIGQYSFPSQLPSTSTSTYLQSTNSIYTATNGYYYNTLQANTSYASPYIYSNIGTESNNSSDVKSPQDNGEDSNVTFRSVPDIMKALQTQLNNTQVDNKRYNATNHSIVSNHVSEMVNNEVKNDELEEPYVSLSKNLQILSKNISGMGFPLSRVARACKLLGDDQKKVVEYLLAMSELLDLGFQETQVANALLKCDNDRDKALDILIL